MHVILFTGEIAQVSTRKDRTVKIILESATEIVDPNELASLFSLKANTVSVAIKESAFSDEDISAIPEPVDPSIKKSESERLRAVIWRWWEARGKQGDSNAFYKANMEQIINQIKEKLPNL